LTHSKAFDVIIIGSGQASWSIASAFAEKAYSIAYIEKNKLGGTCVNFGCTPTKTLVASAKAAYTISRINDFGINVDSSKIDFMAVMKRTNDIVDIWRGGVEKKILENEKITFFHGEASFESKKTVHIKLKNGETTLISGNYIFINTGTRPNIPNIDGIEKINYLTNESILNLQKLPEHLIIIGGGYIGLEFAQIFLRFGSKVTLIHRGIQLLNNEDEDVAEEIYKILTDEGVDIRLNASPINVNSEHDGAVIHLKYQNLYKDNVESVTGTHLLLATGRKPNSDMLNIDKTGIISDNRGYIQTNDKLETNVEGIYAVGDVKGGPAFTHISYDDYRIVVENILKNGFRTINTREVPYTVFIDPQLGRVGINEKLAKKQGIKYKIAKIPSSWVARAYESSETHGFWKVIFDENTDQILGCAILGMEGGEIMSIVQMAMLGKISTKNISELVFAHPTLAEGLNTLFTSGIQ
jgi:pyruvate/2-oxoglutarate dehydrogenase complex dihydrolipoamide dehydrogenase (E3) component